MRHYILCIMAAIGLVTCLQAQPASKPYLYSLKNIYTHPISSKSPLAQQNFDLGMLFLYGYNFDESARYFQEAVENDPQCAICYWGLALALRGNLESTHTMRFSRALENVKKAQELAATASPEERALIKALAESYLSNNDSMKELEKDFAKEMQDVVASYPSDPDAATLYGHAILNSTDDFEGAKKTFQNILKKNPSHPGANHYLIHALDATSEPEEGLSSAKTLEHLVPFIGHLLHMPAHIYYRLGRYQEATQANEKALKADDDFFSKGGLKGDYYSSFYLHNYQFLIATLIMEGKQREALQVAQQLSNLLEGGKPKPNTNLYMQNALAIQKLLILLRFANWDEILKEPKPPTPVGNGIYHFSRTLAYLAQNDLSNAKTEAAAIQDEMVDKSEDSLNVLLKIMSLHAQAAIAEKEGKRTRMTTDLHEAMDLENKITNLEPPLWFLSAREALGYALLRSGKRAEAEKLFKEDLKIQPNKIWSQEGLKRSLQTE